MARKKRLTVEFLEKLYEEYNDRTYVSPDPLQFLYDFTEVKDREIVGLIASSLAYGRVAQILKSITKILDLVGDSPYEFTVNFNEKRDGALFDGFKHRFTTADDMVKLFLGMQHVLHSHGSIENCYRENVCDKERDIKDAMESLITELTMFFPEGKSYLLPHPSKGSACKRFNLFLRWMVRCDDVDPGGWDTIKESELLIPMDTHMHNICKEFGLLKRKSADWKAVAEITNGFRKLNPDDPVKYDFVLTRFGIRDDMTMNDLIMGTTS